MANELGKLTKEELQKRKKELAGKVQAAADEFNKRKADGGEAWPGESRKAWDGMNEDLNAVGRELEDRYSSDEVAQRVEQIRKDEEASIRSGNKPGQDDYIPGTGRTFGDAGMDRDAAARFAKSEADKRAALASWMLSSEHPERITEDMRAACDRVGFNPDRRHLEFAPLGDDSIRETQAALRSASRADREAIAAGSIPEAMQKRALSAETNASGGYLVPQTFVRTLELATLSVGPFLQLMETIQTAQGEDMHWHSADDTSNEGSWVATEGEDTQDAGEPNPTFGRQTWALHEIHSKWIKMPWRLDQDAIVNMVQTLAVLIGQRFGRSFNTAATNGNGTKKCRGLTIDAPTGKTAAAPGAISFDDLIGLEHSVDPNVRAESYYMMHDTLIAGLRLLKDSQGRPLWSPSYREGEPDRVNGRPYAYNQAMVSSIAASAKTVAFGRLYDYKFRRVGNIRIVRAVERFAELLQDGFLGYWRADGKLILPTNTALATVKLLVQPAS